MTTILAFTAGIGLFLILVGFAEHFGLHITALKRGQTSLMSDTEARPVRPRLSPGEIVQTLLYQARAPLSVAEFVFTSVGLGALAGFGMFLASGALLDSFVAFVAGSCLYFMVLSTRRERLSRQYEEVQPQVVYVLYFYLKANGLDFQGMLRHLAEAGPEIAREDWRSVAAALSTARINVEALNSLLTRRSSPGFTRIVEALILFRGENIAELPKILEDLRGDIAQEVEIARESAVSVYSARRQLLLVVLMPVVLAVVFLLVMPSFREFYQGFFGQLLLIGTWVFSGAVYTFGARAATRASMVRPYTIRFPEARAASVYLPTIGNAALAQDENDLPAFSSSKGDKR